MKLQRYITPAVCAYLLAVTAISFVGSDVKNAQLFKHKAACTFQSDDTIQLLPLGYQKKRRVLIVGGDLTGYLAAYFIQQNNGNIKKTTMTTIMAMTMHCPSTCGNIPATTQDISAPSTSNMV